MKRLKKFVVLLLAVTMLVGINTSYVNAEDMECCTHEIKLEGVEEYLNCSYGISHPCYVDGKLVSCQTWYYTIRVPLYCDRCNSFLYYVYRYVTFHQYNHSN